MSEALLMWGVALLGVSVLLVAVEVLLPTGGLVAIAAVGSTIASLVCFYRYDTMWGLLATLAVLILAPVVIAFALHVWPHTAVGRRIILGGGEDEGALRAEREALERERQALVGARGEALTDLRPIGVVRIEGERVEASAEGGLIEKGSQVRVTAIEGNRIKVRRVV